MSTRSHRLSRTRRRMSFAAVLAVGLGVVGGWSNTARAAATISRDIIIDDFETEHTVNNCTGDLGTFSRTFREIVGESPSSYRVGHDPMVAPNCVQMMAMRPLGVASAAKEPQLSSFGEASDVAAA